MSTLYTEKKYKFGINIAILNSIAFIRMFTLLSPIVIFFYKENGLDVKDFFLFQSIFYFTSVLFEVPIGFLGDIFGRKLFLKFSVFLFFLVSVLWYFKSGFWLVLFGEIGLAISKIMLDSSYSGYLYDYLNSKNLSSNMSKYIGYFSSSMSLGTTLASFIGTTLFMVGGTRLILLFQSMLVFIFFVFTFFLKNIKSQKRQYKTLKNSLKDFFLSISSIYINPYLKVFIPLSGIYVAVSIFFSASFQPLMQQAAFPVILFGAVTFINTFTRGISTLFTGKFAKKISLKTLSLSVFLLYVFSFILLEIFLVCKNLVLNFSILIIICLLICFQLIFTLCHISYFHKIINPKLRSVATSVNNFVSRMLAAFLLLISSIMTSKYNLQESIFVIGVIFIFAGSFYINKSRKLDL